MSKFTSAQKDEIVGVYVESAEAGDDYDARTEVVKELAKTYKVSNKVIQGVLVSEKVYVSKTVATKTANVRVDKVALATAFENAMDVKLPSLKNMTGKDLTAMWNSFVKLSDIRNANEGK